MGASYGLAFLFHHVIIYICGYSPSRSSYPTSLFLSSNFQPPTSSPHHRRIQCRRCSVSERGLRCNRAKAGCINLFLCLCVFFPTGVALKSKMKLRSVFVVVRRFSHLSSSYRHHHHSPSIASTVDCAVDCASLVSFRQPALLPDATQSGYQPTHCFTTTHAVASKSLSQLSSEPHRHTITQQHRQGLPASQPKFSTITFTALSPQLLSRPSPRVFTAGSGKFCHVQALTAQTKGDQLSFGARIASSARLVSSSHIRACSVSFSLAICKIYPGSDSNQHQRHRRRQHRPPHYLGSSGASFSAQNLSITGEAAKSSSPHSLETKTLRNHRRNGSHSITAFLTLEKHEPK